MQKKRLLIYILLIICGVTSILPGRTSILCIVIYLIKDYVKKNSNKVSELLGTCRSKALFLAETKFMLDYRTDGLWCTFFMDYTLSCNDMLIMRDVFDGFWWCVSPCFEDGEYRLAVCLEGVTI